jgi:anthranilate phosphoribosyltransferase
MIKEAISQLVSGNSMSQAQAGEVMDEIMTGGVTAAQFGAFVTALRLKGETAEEIAGMAGVMRSRAIAVVTD